VDAAQELVVVVGDAEADVEVDVEAVGVEEVKLFAPIYFIGLLWGISAVPLFTRDLYLFLLAVICTHVFESQCINQNCFKQYIPKWQ